MFYLTDIDNSKFDEYVCLAKLNNLDVKKKFYFN